MAPMLDDVNAIIWIEVVFGILEDWHLTLVLVQTVLVKECLYLLLEVILLLLFEVEGVITTFDQVEIDTC